MTYTITYTPKGSTLRFGEYVRGFWQHRNFITGYAWAELGQRYLRTRLGMAWLILSPLLLAATYTLLVVVLRRSEDPMDLLAFVTSGLFFFLFFRNSVMGAANSLTRASSLLLASDLPKATLPVAATVQSLITFGLAVAAYMPIHLISGRAVGGSVLAGAPLLVISFVFASGLALLLAFGATRVRDLSQFLPYLLRLLLYVSPVLFTLEELRNAVPDSIEGVVWLNPFVSFLDVWHTVLTGTLPHANRWFIVSTWAVAAAAAGIWVAYRRQHSVGAQL